MQRILCIMFLLAVFLSAGVVYASGGEAHEPRWMDLFWRCVTIGLVLGIIAHFAGKPAKAFFADRRVGIEKELHDLEARKEEAKANLQAIEARIANLDAERSAILASCLAQGEAMKMQILAKAEAAAAVMTEQAKQAAQHEIDQAIAAIRSELADRIADTARGSFGPSLSSKEHERLLDSFLNKVVLQ